MSTRMEVHGKVLLQSRHLHVILLGQDLLKTQQEKQFQSLLMQKVALFPHRVNMYIQKHDHLLHGHTQRVAHLLEYGVHQQKYLHLLAHRAEAER